MDYNARDLSIPLDNSINEDHQRRVDDMLSSCEDVQFVEDLLDRVTAAIKDIKELTHNVSH